MNRESNIELLRFVAMMFILLLHANYLSLGDVSIEGILNLQPDDVGRAISQQLCIIGVNLFVLISGWFGIKPTLKGATSLIFQVFFFHYLIIGMGLLIGTPLSKESLNIFNYFDSIYWFVAAYLILYCLSPILNTFVQVSTRKTLLTVIIVFYILQTIFGWLRNYGCFNGGYSALSFIGLYLIARYLYLYSKRLVKLSAVADIIIYFSLSIISVATIFVTENESIVRAYSSPIVVLSAIFFFLAFNKLKISSKTVNFIGCSTFSIYLIHINPAIFQHYLSSMSFMYDYLGGFLYIPYVIAFACIFGMSCVLLDKVRILCWKWSCRFLLDKLFIRISNTYDRLISKSEI